MKEKVPFSSIKQPALYDPKESRTFNNENFHLIKLIALEKSMCRDKKIVFKGMLINYLSKSLTRGVQYSNFQAIHKELKYTLKIILRYLKFSICFDMISFKSDYYNKRKFLPEKSGFYIEKQLIAVKSNVYNCWLRAKVTEVFDDPDIDKRKLKVNI